MERIAVFVNDAAQARHLLQPMLGNAGPTHWIVVACPPTLTRHIGRWVSQPARRAWRERWANQLLAQLEPELIAQAGSKVEKQTASRPLVEVSARLQARWPGLRLLDARRAAVGRADEPITLTQPTERSRGLTGTVVAAGSLAAMLSLTD